MKKIYIKIVVGVIAILILVIGAICFMTYVVPVQSPLVTFLSRKLPAVSVGNDVISRGEIERNVQAAQTFYESQDFAGNGVRIDFTTEEGKKRVKIIEREVINNLVENIVIEELLRQQGKWVGTQDVEMALARTIREGGGTELAKQRAQLYGWTLDEFASNIIKKSLAQERLQKIFEDANDPSTVATEQMMLAKKKLDDGRDFAEVAREHSAGVAAENGGVQGVFTYSQMDPTTAAQVFSLPEGESSDVVESSVGLHIFMVDNFATDENGEQTATINLIFQPKNTFEAYLGEEVNKRNVRIMLPDYVWDDKTNFAYFKNEELRKYEQGLIKQAQEFIEENQLESGSGFSDDQSADAAAELNSQSNDDVEEVGDELAPVQ